MAQHLMVSKVRRHFEKFQAQIVTAEDPLRSWANAAVEVNSVTAGNQTRDDHLRSDPNQRVDRRHAAAGSPDSGLFLG